MQVYLLSLLFVFTTSLSKTPNYYPNYIAAREASKNYNKDLLIFFTKNACTNCDAAWTDFEKDPVASKLYISTSMNIRDFDAAVFLDKYGLNNAPAWLLLDPQGQVKDKWEGEWKKTPTRPTTPKPEPAVPPVAESEKTTKVAPEAPPVVEVTKTAAEHNAVKTEPTAPPQEESGDVIENKSFQPDVSKPVETKTTIQEPPAPSYTSAATGYVLQAGFFGSEANASGLVADLKAKGFEQFSIQLTERNGSTFHRVISTSFPSEAEAQVKVDALQQVGITATIKNLKDL